jgi:hypothetical protein
MTDFGSRLGKAIEEWRNDGQPMTQLQIAFVAGCSLPTAAGFSKGTSILTASHVSAMESYRPGLVRRLYPEAFQGGG